MKIGLVCPYNISLGGGVQECVLELQHELTRRGHIVHILTPETKHENSHSNILYIGKATTVKSFHTTAQVSVSVNTDSVQEILDKYDFDILHFHEPWVPIVSRQILARSRSVNVATFHAKLPESTVNRTIERAITPYTRSILKYLHGLTAVSTAAAEYVGSLSDKDVTIIPNGINVKKYEFNKHYDPNGPILYIGRLEKRKGVKFLIDAFAQLVATHPDARLLIAGDGPERHRLEDQAGELGLPITFLGYVSEEQKLALLKQASLFCSPALYGESFGIVLLEALATGLPVVAGDNPGYSAVLKERGQIGLVNPKDPEQFADRLRLFYEDEPLRELWRQWARPYAEKFDYQAVVDQYENLYKEQIKKHT